MIIDHDRLGDDDDRNKRPCQRSHLIIYHHHPLQRVPPAVVHMVQSEPGDRSSRRTQRCTNSLPKAHGGKMLCMIIISTTTTTTIIIIIIVIIYNTMVVIFKMFG